MKQGEERDDGDGNPPDGGTSAYTESLSDSESSYSSSYSTCSTCSSFSCSCSDHSSSSSASSPSSSSYSSSSDTEGIRPHSIPKLPKKSVTGTKRQRRFSSTKKRGSSSSLDTTKPKGELANGTSRRKRFGAGASCAHARIHHKNKKKKEAAAKLDRKAGVMVEEVAEVKNDSVNESDLPTPPIKRDTDEGNDTASLSSDSYSSDEDVVSQKATTQYEDEGVTSNAEEEPNSVMEPTPLESYIFDELLSEVTLEVAFEMHKQLKTGVLCVNCESTYLDVINRSGVDIFGQPHSQLTIADNCECCNCSRPVIASRFAPHLEKCMGLGRTSSRLATRRMRRIEKPKASEESDGEFSASSQTSSSSTHNNYNNPNNNPNNNTNNNTNNNNNSNTNNTTANFSSPNINHNNTNNINGYHNANGVNGPNGVVSITSPNSGSGGNLMLSDGEADGDADSRDGDWKECKKKKNKKPGGKLPNPKPKKKSKKFSGEEIDLTDPKIRILLHTTCGVISPITGKMCTKTLKCPQHNDTLRNALRVHCNNLVPSDPIPLLGNGIVPIGTPVNSTVVIGVDYQPDKAEEDVKASFKRSYNGVASPPSDVTSQSDDLSPNGSPMVYVDIDGDESEHGFSEVSSIVSPDGVASKRIKVESNDED